MKSKLFLFVVILFALGVFTWHEGEFEVVESAFDVESETSREWAVGERDVVIERVVEVVTAREYGLPFVHRDEEWV